MQKKVIFLSYINFSDPTAGAARLKMYAKMLQEEGVETEFYSIHDFYKTSPLLNKLNTNRAIRYLSYPSRITAYVLSIRKLTNPEKNIVFYLYPTTAILLDYLLVFYLKKLTNQKVFLEINEVRKWGNSVNKNSLRYFKYVQYEKLSSYFDGLVCISKNIEIYYRNYNNNTLRIPILSDTNITYKSHCNYQMKKQEPFNIGFTGSIDINKENLKVFFSALNKLSNKGYDIVFNLYGVMSKEKDFYSLVSFYNLCDIVKYHGRIEHNLISSVLAKQDLLVLPRAETLANKYGFSTKLSEYLVSGVPVLVTDVSDNLTYLTSKVDCLLANFDSSDSFAEQIEALIINYDIVAKELAENAFSTANNNFNYLLHSKRFKAFLGLDMNDPMQ